MCGFDCRDYTVTTDGGKAARELTREGKMRGEGCDVRAAAGVGSLLWCFPNKSEQLFFHFGSSQFIFRAGRDRLGGARIARKNALKYALDESG